VTRSPAECGFAPQVLRNYALIADGERGALIGPNGEIAWMCAPRWHSEAVFSSLIGGQGIYAVTPEATRVWGGSYQPGSLVWRNRWVTTEGAVECHDALALPASCHRLIVLRRVSAHNAAVPVRVLLDPRDGFGESGLQSLRRDKRHGWTGRLGNLHLRWSGDVGRAQARRGRRGHLLTLSLSVKPGERRDLILELSDRPFADPPPDPERLWKSTQAEWDKAVPQLDNVLAPRDARHAYAVMRGLTSSDDGMVAAVTTSLPERAEAGRNYDYRYAWIRDQCFAGQAAAAAGAPALLDTAVRFVSARLHCDGPALAPAYTADGGPVPAERRLGFPGYPGGFDLVGNWVRKQFQLDVFGEALLLLATAAQRDRLDSDGWRAVEIAADAVASRWREPDAGIWEIDNQAWTHSRLICVAGLRAAAARPGPSADSWSRLADTILADTAAHATHPSGRWQRSDTDPRLDGSLLIPPLRGGVPADDPRTAQTLRAYTAELTEDGYAYRFRPDDRPLGEAEGAFLLCGFLLALAHHQQGNHVDAARWFERNRAACGPPGLYSEEYDVAERQLRGNLPQAFVHAIMLESAAWLASPPDIAPPAHRATSSAPGAAT
jgi:alpha,alpha-trehalase